MTEPVSDRDDVQHVDHLQQPYVASAGGPQAFAAVTPEGLADQYLRDVGTRALGIDETMLPGAPAGLADGGSLLVLAEEKQVFGTTSVSYQQTFQGLPVWEAGVTVTVLSEPMRVTASQSSVHPDVSVPEPGGRFGPDEVDPPGFAALLGLGDAAKVTLNGTRALIYRYEPDQRTDPQVHTDGGFESGPPTLDLPPVPDEVVAGQHYVVTEVLFTLPVEGYGVGAGGGVNWRAFVEQRTGAVLYLRAFVAAATALVFRTDPLTAGGGESATPIAGPALLNGFRAQVPLDGLTAANPQGLAGEFVEIVDSERPVFAPPRVDDPPGSFHFDVATREFSAVNAYHHCDALFRYMAGMGFDVRSYFDGTRFPIPVDACALNDGKNAMAPGNVRGDGSGGFVFGLTAAANPAACGIAADARVVWHEFGHTLLWDSVHHPNFGFAHSAGDSLAAILLDPESALRDGPGTRFATFPWLLPNRRHDRDVTEGWGWAGSKFEPFVRGGIDQAGYLAEQMLSTTLFRFYRALGGDAADVRRRQLAARQTAYLIFRAIGTLAGNPIVRTPRPDVFATSLMNADIGTADFEGYRGGAVHKMIRWAFEKQGLYQPPGTQRPADRPGAPPDVDVYIEDSATAPRQGEYEFQEEFGESPDVWNRVDPGPGGGEHEAPVPGQTNFAYARVRNRGTQPARNVRVRGFAVPAKGDRVWPADYTPLGTPELAVGEPIPPGGSVLAGPFEWTPDGEQGLLMAARADGDPSVIDPETFNPCATGPTPEWQLVPFDNNLALRAG
ncbi:hypothetical protein [Paractinoplanes rishiriensis]|uniref:FTP domain-containing protein n=1 Tax=Paractinoplanes rishiriensis TaxID=1050105 RepID=A0A919MY86_9ACTN|nr:hypothetical protein [Actinoplanes rishiriensis]GIE99564.1 hypothetical protein Ari01nite_70290 [Actinoplanes rishiriensis]